MVTDLVCKASAAIRWRDLRSGVAVRVAAAAGLASVDMFRISIEISEGEETTLRSRRATDMLSMY